MLSRLFSKKQRYDQEELFALRWKKPDSINLIIKESDGEYYAKVTTFKHDNVATQAKTGQELLEMINDAVYEYLDIPEVYRADLGYFLPDEKAREELKIKIPAKYLNREFAVARS